MSAAADVRADLVRMVEEDSFPPPPGQHASAWLANPPDYIARWAAQLGPPAPIEAAQAPPAAASGQLRTLADLLAAPSTPFVVGNLVPARGLTAIYGAPGSGKSFLAMDLVLAIAVGCPTWFGRRVTPRAVAYVALEGQGGIPDRVRAWLKHTCRAAPANVRFYTNQFSLLDDRDAERVAHLIREELGPGTVTVIDTLSQATPGGDENSSIDMTKAIRNADALGSIVEGPVILVHHSGKDAGRGMRGHTSLLGAVSTTIEVATTSAGSRSFTVKKNKDGPDGVTSHFELVAHAVNVDQWGDEVRSCAVRELASGPLPTLPAVRGKHQKAVMAAVRQALSADVPTIGWDQAVQLATASIDATNNRRATVAKETLNALRASGHLLLNEEGLRLAPS